MLAAKRSVLALVFASIGIALSAQAKPFGTPEKGVTKQSSSPNTENTTTSEKDKDTGAGVTVIVNQEKSPGNKPNESETDENIQIQRKLANFTAWLVVVGFIQAAILFFTVRAIIHQASVSKDTERAWIIATNVEPLKEIEYQSDREFMQFYYPNKFKNSGRTPARVTKAHVRFHLVPPRKDAPGEPDLPEKPDYGRPIPTQIPKDGRVVVPQEKFILVVRFEGSKDRQAMALNREERDAVYAGTMILVTYGLIEYLDAFRKQRELRFCRAYHFQRGFDSVPTGFYLGGPSEYNKAT